MQFLCRTCAACCSNRAHDPAVRRGEEFVYNHGLYSGMSPCFDAFCTKDLLILSFLLSTSDFRFRFATARMPGEPNAPEMQWQLRRNCSVTPAQLLQLYISLCVVSLGIATLFWVQGAYLILPFAWLEVMVVGAAFLIYARHARDGEKIMLQGSRLVVELETAGRIERAEFERQWVRVEPKGSDGSLIEVSGQGHRVSIGRHLRPELRPALAREIRFALRGA